MTKENSNTYRVIHYLAFGSFFISGFLSLVYEICWIRKSSLVFGSTSFAVATTLAIFFGGMAVGSYVASRIAGRCVWPMKVYGLLEIVIGIYAILSPLIFTLVDSCLDYIYPWVHLNFISLCGSRILLLGFVLALPTFLIGIALPLFCRQFVQSDAQSENRIATKVGFLCGVNTIGATLGCVLTGLLFIRYVGVDKTLIIAGFSNILVGCLLWSLPFKELTKTCANFSQDQQSTEITERFDLKKRQVVPLLISICGFVALGLEVVWTRYLSLLIHNTTSTYTLTLAFILCGIFLGNLFASIFLRYSKRHALLFGNLQVLLGISVLALLLLPASWWQSWVSEHNTDSHLAVLALLFVPPSILSGISFPLAVGMVVNQANAAPRGVGKMMALNTFGGIFGALLIGFVAIPVIGLYGSVLFITGLSVFGGLIAWIFLADEISKSLRAAMVVLSLLLFVGIPMLTQTKLPQDYLAGNGKLLDYREGLGSFMAVVDNQGKRQLEIDRLWQGETGRNHQSMAAHIPMFHHDRPEDVLVIGFGAGQTAKSFLMHPAIKSLDCVDLEKELVELIRKHFDSRWLDDPRVCQIVDDGRNFLTHTQKKYDLISIEAGQTFRPQVAKLYSYEFYENARQRLKPDGILAQFIPISMLNSEQFLLIVKTFLESFPQSALWYNSSELLLIGTVSDQLALSNDYLERLAQNSTLQKDMEFSYWGGPEFWVIHPQVFAGGFLCGSDGLQRLTKDASIYRDEIPWLEYSFSPYDSDQSLEIINLIESVLEPAALNFDYTASAEVNTRIGQVQLLNLGDLRGSAVSKQARLKLKEEKLSSAIQLFQQAAKSNPKSVEFLNNLGMALRASGDLRSAENQFRAVLDEDSRSSLALNNLGITLLEQRRTREAIRYLERAVTINPDYEDAYFNLGNALLSARRPQEAVSNYKTAIALDPEDAVNYMALIRVLIMLKDTEQAKSYYLKVKKMAPHLTPPPGFADWAS